MEKEYKSLEEKYKELKDDTVNNKNKQNRMFHDHEFWANITEGLKFDQESIKILLKEKKMTVNGILYIITSFILISNLTLNL